MSCVHNELRVRWAKSGCGELRALSYAMRVFDAVQPPFLGTPFVPSRNEGVVKNTWGVVRKSSVNVKNTSYNNTTQQEIKFPEVPSREASPAQSWALAKMLELPQEWNAKQQNYN